MTSSQSLIPKPLSVGYFGLFPTKYESALSYFVGNNPKYPTDSGFGIKDWLEVKSETSSVFIDQNVAMWMGWVTLINKEGNSVKVDKSWGYKKTENGILKIVLQNYF